MTIQYRDLAGLAEFRAAQQMQQTVWGNDDQPDPADLMMVVQSEGGICAGAFEVLRPVRDQCPHCPLEVEGKLLEWRRLDRAMAEIWAFSTWPHPPPPWLSP